jgi:AcrR family transcriptional regulator
MPGRPRLASDAAILAATARAISRVGPVRLTLADVAAEVGLAPATLLQRFGSKRGLLLAFAALGTDAVAATFAAARRETDSPLAALIAALTALTRDVDTPEALANHLAFLQVDLSDPEFRHHALAQAAAMREEIRALLDEAVRAGELVRLQSARVARAVQTTYNGSLLTWAVAREGPLAGWLREDLDLMLQPYKPL